MQKGRLFLILPFPYLSLAALGFTSLRTPLSAPAYGSLIIITAIIIIPVIIIIILIVRKYRHHLCNYGSARR